MKTNADSHVARLLQLFVNSFTKKNYRTAETNIFLDLNCAMSIKVFDNNHMKLTTELKNTCIYHMIRVHQLASVGKNFP